LAFSTLYYVYYTDSNFDGGSVFYSASTIKEDSLQDTDAFFVGSILTPGNGGADTTGNNDGGVGTQYGLSHRAYFPDYTTAVSGNGNVSNPELAVDIIPETAATLAASGNSSGNYAQIVTKGLAAAFEAAAKNRRVWVIFEVPANTLNGSGNVWSLYYSVQGDSWYVLWDSGGPGVTKALTVYSFNIPQSKLGDIRVRFEVMTGATQTTGSITAKLYESWVEIF
jgi:hypothetical protein